MAHVLLRQQAFFGPAARSQPSCHAGMASVSAKRRIAASEPTGPDSRHQNGTNPARSRDESSHGRAKTTLNELFHHRRDERSSSLLLPASPFGSAKKRRRRASLLQIDQWPTTLHKALINPKRSSAAQYVYNTKSQVAVHSTNYNRTH